MRTEHVGSLQRPEELMQARLRAMIGKITPEELHALENEAIDDAFRLQRETGVGVLTDGEMRRLHYGSHVIDAIDGYSKERFGWIDGKLTKARRFFDPADVAFSLERAQAPLKMTMPTPCLVRPEMLRFLFPGMELQDQPPAPYADWSEVQADIVDAYIDEMQKLADEGVSRLQFDKVITAFVDDEIRAAMRAGGEDPVEALAAEIACENRAYDSVAGRGVTTSIHFCRGNRGNTEEHFGSGPYDAAAEQLFSDLHVDRLLLEYDTDRAGGFEPLRFVPQDRVVVLGLVSTKTPDLEDQDALLRRIDEASRFIDPGQLALGPQCGFASGARPGDSHYMSIDAERAKLELIVDTAQRAWG